MLSLVKSFRNNDTVNLDCVHTMPAHFENDEKCDGSKIWASVHTMPEQFENGW